MFVTIEEAAHELHYSELQIWALIINRCVGYKKHKGKIKVKYEDLDVWARRNPETYEALQKQPTDKNPLAAYFGINVQYKFKQVMGFDNVVSAKVTKPDNQIRFGGK